MYVRNKPEYSDLPIIMLTTNKMEKKEDEIAGLNINGWIVKPFDIFNFYDTIEAQINCK